MDDEGTYSGSGGGLAYTATGSSFIGSDSGYKDTFDGVIAEVAVYKTSLSSSEIQARMYTKLGGSEAGLVGYWNLDEGSGQVVGDSSGNGNYGQLGSTAGADDSDPAWIALDSPVTTCREPVAIDIRPGSCRNPLNLNSRGVLSMAIMGTAEFDAATVDPASVRLEGAAPLRSSLEDVGTPVGDAEECECNEDGPDGYVDLVLKFSTQDIVEQLLATHGQVAKKQVVSLGLTADLFDNTSIEGMDCVALVGNVSRWLTAKGSDMNSDGVIDLLDFVTLTTYWRETEED